MAITTGFQGAKKSRGIVDGGRMQKQNTADLKEFSSETSSITRHPAEKVKQNQIKVREVNLTVQRGHLNMWLSADAL